MKKIVVIVAVFLLGGVIGYFSNSSGNSKEIRLTQEGESCEDNQEKMDVIKAEMNVIDKYSDLMFGYVCIASEVGSPQSILEEIEKSIIATGDQSVVDEYNKLSEASQEDLITKAIPGFMRFLVNDVTNKL